MITLTRIPNADDSAAILRDTLIAASTYLAECATRISDPILDPFALMSDSDDYMPAAANIARMITMNTFASDHADARAALYFLVCDPEFLEDASVADFNAPIFDLVPDLFDY